MSNEDWAAQQHAHNKKVTNVSPIIAPMAYPVAPVSELYPPDSSYGEVVALAQPVHPSPQGVVYPIVTGAPISVAYPAVSGSTSVTSAPPAQRVVVPAIVSSSTALSNAPPGSQAVYTITVDLPLGVTDAGLIVLSGSPPRIQQLANLPQYSGYFLIQFSIPGVLDMTNLSDSSHVMTMIRGNAHAPRQIVLSSYRPNNFQSEYRCIYHHMLPSHVYAMGLRLEGFSPPHIVAVDTSSPMQGKVYPGQVVLAVLVPGRPVLDRNTAGFTGYRVQQYLDETAAVLNRQLIVADRATAGLTSSAYGRERGSNGGLDLGGFGPNAWFRSRKHQA